MIGSGTLIECLDHPDVERVLVVGRRPCGVEHEKLVELVHDDFLDFSCVADALTGYDTCLYCLGISSTGLSEAEYKRVTYDMAVAAARTLLAQNPRMSFCFVSGAGADGSERSRQMWARVKGRTENRLQQMDFNGVWCFRPAFVQPKKGVRSRTALYNAFYTVLGPLYPLIRYLPWLVTDTETLALALIRAGRDGAPRRVLENADIVAMGRAERASLRGEGR